MKKNEKKTPNDTAQKTLNKGIKTEVPGKCKQAKKKKIEIQNIPKEHLYKKKNTRKSYQ